MFFIVLMLTACGRYAEAPENSDVYVVEMAEVDEESAEVVFYLRSIDAPLVVPIDNCKDGLDYPKGTVVLIDDDFVITKINDSNGMFWITILVLCLCVLVLYKNSSKKQ